ncbi:MAG TPA: hypothetical protein PLL54_03680 [Dermatophilaceae bacterium]|nr:hypothetical protein [Dermatophilaceae bacterium]
MSSAQVALPLPVGRPGPFHGLVASLQVAADRIAHTCLAHGSAARDLAPSWGGAAWRAAEAELHGARIGAHALSEAVSAAAGVLHGYAGHLDATITAIAGLQRTWEHAETRHRRLAGLAAAQAGTPESGPTLAELDLDLSQERARLRVRHTQLMAALTEAGAAAAAALRVCRATPLTAPRPGTSMSGDWYEGLSASLPMSVHSLRTVTATETVAAAFAHTPPLHEWSSEDVAGIVRLDTADPAIASALMESLGIDGLTLLATRLAKTDPQDPSGMARATLALARLGTALRVALDPQAWADDPRWVSRVQETTARWRAAVSEPRATKDLPTGFPVLAVQAQTLLLHASRDGGTRPLSSEVLVSLATAAAAAEADGAIWTTVPGSDPMALVVAELDRQAGEAWRVLMRDVSPEVSLLDYLVARRGRFLDDERAARAVAIDLDHLMSVVSTRTDRPSVQLAGAFLGSLATAVVTTEDVSEGALQMSRYLTNFRPSLAAVLLAHPALITTVLQTPLAVDSDTLAAMKGWGSGPVAREHRESATASAFDLSPPTFSARVWLVDDGSEPTLHLDDITTLRSLLGLVGLAAHDQLTLDGDGVSIAPVLARATAPDVDALVASLRSHDAEATRDAATRMGALYGFGITAAAMLQSDRAATVDAQIETQRAVVQALQNVVRLPAKAQATPIGIVAGLALDRLMSEDPATFFPSLRLHAIHDANVEQAGYAAATRIELRLRAWDVVSESRCWSVAAGPEAWLRRHPGPDFTDGAGRPLSLAAMTSDQRVHMLQWAMSVPEYGRIDAAIRAGFTTGQDLATAAMKPAVHLEQLADLGTAQP